MPFALVSGFLVSTMMSRLQYHPNFYWILGHASGEVSHQPSDLNARKKIKYGQNTQNLTRIVSLEVAARSSQKKMEREQRSFRNMNTEKKEISHIDIARARFKWNTYPLNVIRYARLR